MPEDQEQTTPRRRTRRQSVAAPQEQPATENAAVPVAAAAESADTPAPRATRRRTPRAAAAATEASAQTASAPAATPHLEAAAAQDDETAAPSPASRTRRRAPRAAAQQEAAVATPPTEAAPVAPESAEQPPVSRASRGRRGRRTDEAASVAVESQAPAAPVIAGTPVEEVVDAASPPVRGRRGRRATDASEVSGDAAMPATEPPISITPAEAAPSLAPASELSDLQAPSDAPEQPASPYRFNRRRRTDERVTASGVPVIFEAPEPTPATPSAIEQPPLMTEGGAEPAQSAPRAYEPGVRPLRRQDRPGWAGRDRAIPGAAPAEPYRRGDQQNTGRAPSMRPSQQQRNAPGQGPAPRGPYLPGGRGQGTANPSYDPAQPYAPNNGAPNNGASQSASGYPPYAPYDQYQGYGPGAPVDREPRTPPAPARPLRGRGYSGQQGFEPRDQRGPRGSSRGMGVQDNYRDQQGPRDRGYTGRRGMNDRTNERVSDRRGGIGGRGAMGRQGRDRGYGNAPYGAPSYGNAPANAPGAPAEPRYEGRYGRIAGPAPVVRTVDVSGLLWLGGGAGMGPAEVLDGRTLQSIARMNPEDVRRMGLRSGDEVRGRAEERNNRRIVVAVESVNGVRPEELRERPTFEQLTASFPDRRIRMEQGPLPISSRIIDLFSPLGFGSRALIVAPPKTGKTTLIREAAESVLTGYPDAVVMAVLVGERPEEVTDLRMRLEPRGGLVYAASFDEDTQRHAWLVQVAVERAKRVAESGRDAFMVLDSLTRLARAENLATRGQGRTLSGGIDAQALDTGRRAFGAARNLEEGGSITILATCLVDTGSRQDDVVYEEFKGTGNMELHLSRDLAQRRLFPAVDAVKSGTRREEMLLTPDELRAATALRRRLADLPVAQATQQLLSVMERTPSNSALLSAIEQSGWTNTVR